MVAERCVAVGWVGVVVRPRDLRWPRGGGATVEAGGGVGDGRGGA